MDPEDFVPDDVVQFDDDMSSIGEDDLVIEPESPAAPQQPQTRPLPPPPCAAVAPVRNDAPEIPAAAPATVKRESTSVPQAKRRRAPSNPTAVPSHPKPQRAYIELRDTARAAPAATAAAARGPRRRGAVRTPYQAEVVEEASRRVEIAEFEAAAPTTPREMLVNALALKRGEDVPYASLFGPPPSVDTASVGHVPRGSTFLELHISDVLRVVEPRRKPSTAPSHDPLPARVPPRLLTGHDMQRHYLWEARERPSPLAPNIILRPQGCVLGSGCMAMRYYQPMLEGFLQPFPLVGMLSEPDMRRFYETGQWPAKAHEPCVICHLMLPQTTAVIINNLAPSSRNPVVQYQAVRNDSDARTGFKPVALSEPGTENSVVEFPMMECRAGSARVRNWSAGVRYLDISPALNSPVPCDNSSVWSSDEHNVAAPPVTPLSKN